MTITSVQLKLYLTGGAANSNPNLSLGGVTSSVQFTDNTLNNLFADVTAAEAAAGSTKYRALAFKNTSAETGSSGLVYIYTETSSADTTIEIGYDSVGTQSIVNEDTPPSGVSFSKPLSLAAGIALGDIAASGERRIWFKRIVTAAAAYTTSDAGAVRFAVGSV